MNQREYVTADDITFDFEPFLEQHEENLPSGLDAQYMAYIPYLEAPLKNIFKLPTALRILPMNAVLHQGWKTIFSLFGILLVMAIPSFALVVVTAVLLDKAAVGIALIIFIMIGLFVSILYMKTIYETLNNLVDSRKAPWLVEKIERPFNDAYQRSWSKKLLTLSFILPLMVEIPLVFISLNAVGFDAPFYLIVLLIIAIVIGHIGISMMVFISLLSIRYILLNTRIYDRVMQPIIDRVRGYTDGHESILTKKNYEVVGVLSDTPGLSIRSLGNIPTFGLGAGIFVTNSLIFLLFTPALLYGPLADYLAEIAKEASVRNPNIDEFGLNYIILLGVVLSSLLSIGLVIRPLIRITRVMGNFKNKALTELDPFIFDEITGVALRRDTEITNETEVLFMLRNYIYSMKVSPVNPFRLVQVILLAIVYSSRGLPIIINLFT